MLLPELWENLLPLALPHHAPLGNATDYLTQCNELSTFRQLLTPDCHQTRMTDSIRLPCEVLDFQWMSLRCVSQRYIWLATYSDDESYIGKRRVLRCETHRRRNGIL